MKASAVLVFVCSAIALAACGSSSSDSSTVTGEESAQIEKLQLEKEKAEVEAEAAKAEAKRESAEARRVASQASRKKAVAAKAKAEDAEPEPEEVPDVVGMRLPEARSTLQAAGYEVQAENTDTAFGIVVPSHYTICEQSEPHGTVVTVLAQKYGC